MNANDQASRPRNGNGTLESTRVGGPEGDHRLDCCLTNDSKHYVLAW